MSRPSSHSTTPVIAADEEHLLTLREAAERFAVPQATLEKRVRAGQIPAVKRRRAHGAQWMVSPAAIEAFGYVAADERLESHEHFVRLKRELIVASNRADRFEQWARESVQSTRRLQATVDRQAAALEEVRLLLARVTAGSALSDDQSITHDIRAWLDRLAVQSIPSEPRHGELPQGFPTARHPRN